MEALRKALAVTMKDLRVVSSDRGYIIAMFLVPLIVGLINASIYGGESSAIRLPTIVINQDAGDFGDSIVNIMQDIDVVELTPMDSQSEAEQKLLTGEYLAAVVIPADLSKNIDQHEPTDISVILDPAQANYGNIITSILEEITSALAIQGEIRYGIQDVLSDMGYDPASNPNVAQAAQAQVEGVLFTQFQRMQVDEPILLSSDVIKGRKVYALDSIVAIVLPAFTVMFAFFIVPAASTDLIKEREAGSLRRLVAAPLPRGSLIGGKVLAYLLVVLIQVTLLFGIGALIMDMRLGDSPLALILVTLGLGLSATTLGMMVAALARSADQAGSIGVLLVFVLGILAGGMTPLTPLYQGEGIIALLSRLTPQAQAQMSYLSLINQGGTLVEVLPHVAYLFGFSLLCFLIAIWRFKFSD